MAGISPCPQGGLLRDDADWSSTGLKDGAKLMMMGTAEKPIEAPKQRIEFVEDLPEAEQAAQDTRAYGAGLTNLGNTCYMNATVQCLFRVPELRQALQGLTDGGATGSLQRMALSTRGLFQALESSKGPPVTPMAFLAVLRDMFPQFAQTGAEGMPMQQDAEECWTGLLNVLSQRVDAAHMGDGAPPLRGLFEIGFEAKLTCAGTGETWEERTSQLMLKVGLGARSGAGRGNAYTERCVGASECASPRPVRPPRSATSTSRSTTSWRASRWRWRRSGSVRASAWAARPTGRASRASAASRPG